MKKIKFNKVYFDHSESGFVKLAFINTETKNGMYFETNTFYYRDFSKHPISIHSDMKYPPCTEINPFCIEAIKGSSDICFIKMSNGDIFQIFFMADGSKNQLLSIFGEISRSISTPLGISSYDAAYKNFIEEEDAEIGVWETDIDE